MALYQFLCGLTVMIVLSSKGCHSNPKCGRAVKNNRTAGGQDVPPGSWPWQVSLNTDKNAVCAGSLISDEWVMTAAQCITGENIWAIVGRNNQSGPNPNEESRGIARSIIHPSYNSITKDNDIALLKLSAPVNFTDYIYPVCLASANSTFHNGTSSWVAGWGVKGNGSYSDILQDVNTPIVGKRECECTYNGITENMICAGLRARGQDACTGDSGAPLVTKKGQVWIQSGIVSFGRGCARRMTPRVYTRVSQYHDWISSIVGRNTSGFVNFTSPGVDSDVNITCPTKPPRPSPTSPRLPGTIYPTIITPDGSVFDSGENVMHFSQFISLCLLGLSLHVLA